MYAAYLLKERLKDAIVSADIVLQGNKKCPKQFNGIICYK